MSIALYRAMCHEEAVKTLAAGRPQFVSRYKWFSPSFEFVRERVQDGEFNNSKWKPERYTELLRFIFSDKSLPYFVQNGQEYRLDRRESMVTCEMVSRREVANGEGVDNMRLETIGDYLLRIVAVKEDLETERGLLEDAEVEIMDAESRRVAAEKDIRRLESEVRALDSKLSALTG